VFSGALKTPRLHRLPTRGELRGEMSQASQRCISRTGEGTGSKVCAQSWGTEKRNRPSKRAPQGEGRIRAVRAGAANLVEERG